MGVEEKEEGDDRGKGTCAASQSVWATFHQYLIGSPESPREVGNIP